MPTTPEDLEALRRDHAALLLELSAMREAFNVRLHALRNPLTATLSALIALTTPELAVPEAQRQALLESALAGARRLEDLLKDAP